MIIVFDETLTRQGRRLPRGIGEPAGAAFGGNAAPAGDGLEPIQGRSGEKRRINRNSRVRVS